MKKPLKKPNSSPAALATMAIAEELARQFPPKVIAGKIKELLNAVVPGKVVNGKKEPDRPNERTVEAGIKLIALLQQLADNERRQGGGAPPPAESDAEILERLAASPSARKAAASFLAGFDDKEQKTLEMGVDESPPSESGDSASGSDREE